MCAVIVLSRFMYQFREFVQSHVLGLLTEHKEQALDQIRLSGSVQSDHFIKALVQWSYLICTIVRLKIFKE